jgi:hypothetical protein|tara:strand:+ start:10895 stop:11020 length:126 start_codon:yes stop_codon:yes gene_type:complete
MVETNKAAPTSDEQKRLAASTGQLGIPDIIFPICIVAHSGF